MIDRIKRVLDTHQVPHNEVLGRYSEPHRYYHNIDHVVNLLTKAEERDILSEDLFLAILFHDVVYDPKRTDNENLSAKLFSCFVKNDVVRHAILDTQHHIPTNYLSKILCDLDMEDLYGDFDVFMNNSEKIAKEYAYLDWTVYIKGRTEFLQAHGVDSTYIKAMNRVKPKIGLYPGSFNPFHVGHMDILLEAEKIFDKVIIARGINPEKNSVLSLMPSSLEHRQVEHYDGLLTDFIKSLNYEVTVIRGLRNCADFEYEINQYRYLRGLDESIKVVNVFSNKQYDHISSSGVKTLLKYGKGEEFLIN